MNKRLSILFVFMLLFQTIVSSFAQPISALAEGNETSIFQAVTLLDVEGKALELADAKEGEEVTVQVDWSLADVEPNASGEETHTLSDVLQIQEEQQGVLTYEDAQWGTYLADTDGNVTITYPETEQEVRNSEGTFVIKALVKKEETETEEESTVPEESTDSAEQEEVVDQEEAESKDTAEEESTEEATDEEQSQDKQRSKVEKAEVNSFVASEITENLITDVTLSQRFEDSDPIELVPGEEIRVDNPYDAFQVAIDYKFALPDGHQYGAGSTYKIKVPDLFSVQPNPEPTALKTAAGVQFGEFIVNGDNEIVIMFNENIEENSNIAGYINLWSAFDAHYAGAAEGEEITFPIAGENSITYPITFEPRGTAIDKRGVPDKSYNTNKITWTVDFNKNLQTIENAVLADETTGEQKVIDGSMKVYKLHMNANGTIDEGKTEELSSHGFGTDFPLQLGTIDSAYRVVYETEITDEKGTSYKNKATLDGENAEPVSAEASVGVKRGSPLEKRSSDYDSATQTITWEVKYNYDEKEISRNDALLTDVLEGNHELISDSFEVKEIAINPDTGAEAGSENFNDYTLNETADGYTLQFNKNIDKAYKITYKTKATDRVLDNESVSNTITDGSGNEKGGSRGLVQQVLHKSNDNNAKYDEKTTGWTVRINRDEHTMQDVNFSDTLPKGFTPRDIVVTHGGSQLGEEKYTLNFDADRNLLTIDFHNTITKEILITYTTDINFDEVDHGTKTFKNKAKMDWIPEGGAESDRITKEASATFTPDGYTVANGFKHGSYNMESKVIDWKIGVNYNKATLHNVVVEDIIQGEQNFELNSVKVYKMKLTGGANGYEKGEEVTLGDNAIESFTTDEGEQGFRVHLGDIRTPYLITFETDLNDQLIDKSYDNKATVTSSNRDSFDLTASVSPKHGREYTNKTANQNAENPRVVNWRLNINYTQSTVSNVKVTDTPSANQSFLKDSFHLYETIVSPNEIKKGEALEEGEDYTLTFEENDEGVETFTLTFLEEIDRAYVLEYDTYILHKGDGNINNNATFTGEGTEGLDTGDQVNKPIRLDGIGGGIDGEVGSLEVLKTDAADNTPLAGAEFTLYDKTGENAIRTYITGEDGKVTFKNLLYGDYILKETGAPEGYVTGIQDTKTVTVDAEVSTETISNKKITRHVQLTKEDAETGDVLAGVTFKLVNEAGETVKADLVTNEEGIITVKDLVPGKYAFIETEALFGYEQDETPIEFTIGEKQTEVKKVKAKNDILLGAVTLQKVDVDNNNAPLQGAVFELQNASGEAVSVDGKKTFTTNENGEISIGDLRPGTYYFVEKEAPEHYVLDADPIKVVVEKGQTETAIVQAENALITGSVALTKKGEDGKLLDGVVFELQTQEGETVKSELQTGEDGKLVVEDLKPGLYQFVETASIPGYELNTNVEKFEIVKSQQEPIEVEFTNDLTPGSVLLTKVGEEGEDLEGAEFELRNGASDVIHEGLTTNKNGQIEVTNLKPGFYTFIETKAPFGHELDGSPIVFEIEFNQQTQETVTKENERTTSAVELTKKGEDDKLLEGVVFELQDDSGNTLQEDLVTNVDGTLQVDHLKPGNYQFVETASIPGYDLDPTAHTFTIELGPKTTVEVEAVNELTTGSVVLSKIGEENEALRGAVFELQDAEGSILQSDLITNEAGEIEVLDLKPGSYQFVETKAPFGHDLDATPVSFEIEFNQQEQLKVKKENSRSTSSVTLAKFGEDGKLLEGVTFELQNEAGEVLQEGLQTDKDGDLTIDDLKPGHYVLVETDTIAGYDLNATPIPFEIKLGQETATEIDFENALSTGSVSLTKIGEEDEVLEGAQFDLLNADGEIIQSGLVTNEEGTITVLDLKPGDYQFIETKAPFGHDLDETPIAFEIVFDQQEQLELEMENSRTTSSVELTKVDNETKEVLEGAVFDVRQGDDVIVEGVTSDKDGKIFVDELKPGNYQFVETAAPEGYHLSDEPIPFTIELGQTETLKLTTDNTIIKGSFHLTKVDFDHQDLPLEGVQFELQNEAGDTLQEEITTNEAGELQLHDLRPGNYVLVETKPLFGYEAHEPIAFTIDKGQLEAKQVTITNMLSRGSVELTKQNEQGELLQGAIFELQDAEGNTLQTDLVSDENGKIFLGDLKPGSYQFVEAEAPTGYVLDEIPISFEIEIGQEETVHVTATNKKVPASPSDKNEDKDPGTPTTGDSDKTTDNKTGSTLPKTATDMYQFMLIGLGLLLAGGVIYLIARRKRQAE
ncbi:SpaA isopeptide-forming pilin-related protein [Oceanobacillus sp. M65]|uniref:SpaA isopeptide-forming pilin-related protein n=1 Tax=Oceanobacillus sp. M65 TaxID=3457435 RepID=UPI003FCC781F